MTSPTLKTFIYSHLQKFKKLKNELYEREILYVFRERMPENTFSCFVKRQNRRGSVYQ